MAKFNVGGNPTEEASVGHRPFKVSGQNSPSSSSSSSSSGIQARKNLFDSGQGHAAPAALGAGHVPKPGAPKPPLAAKPAFEEKAEKEPKPPFLKPTARLGAPSSSSAARDPEAKVGFLKPVGPRPAVVSRDDPKAASPRPHPGTKPSPHGDPQDPDGRTAAGVRPGPAAPAPEDDQRPVFPKLAAAKGKFASTQGADPKPHSARLGLGPKPSPGAESSPPPPPQDEGPPRAPDAKARSGPSKAARENPEPKERAGDPPSSPFAGVVLRPAASRGSPGPSRAREEKREDRKMDAAKNIFLGRASQEDPAKLPKPASKPPWGKSQEKEAEDKNAVTPKRKPLPPLFILGPPPSKPSRPPNVDLTRFLKADSANGDKGQTPYSATALPPPPPSHPVSQPPLPASHPTQSPAPSLPPRNIKPSLDLRNTINEDNQDGFMHSDGKGHFEGETYEDIESSKERDKKWEKEEKKRLELERKEQKEKEKKEQELRKKFKLTGPVQVIHHAKACCDVKGGKNELSFKQGEEIEIIRLTDNPEGKWLGRTSRGSYGYIKTTAVEIDYDSLKLKKNSLNAVPSRLVEDDQEVYDDVAEQDAPPRYVAHRQRMFPPPDEDIYDGIEEGEADNGSALQVEEKSNTWSWGILKKLKGKDDRKKSVREKLKVSESDSNEGPTLPKMHKGAHASGVHVGEEVYDDVDASDFPVPPAETSQGTNVGKARSEEKDPKKLKKQEKEEKDFRKKFKYDGEIRVLYSTKVSPSLTSKKWGARDLQIKAGELLEVIQSTDDTKVLCRSEEGKCECPLSCVDGEIYDDIADGCIYDND
uniref:FYN binding protein 1 n=1 Tax=Jaculus jaculus TaxID=51337 RepID=A0A8C5KPG5_JACJA